MAITDIDGGTVSKQVTLTNLGTLIGGGISNVVEDTTPQLGGDLDFNSNDITGTGNINHTGTITTTGVLSGATNIDYTGQASSPIHALSDGATITPDFNDGNIQEVTITANRTLSNPTNQKSGGTYSIIVKQDGVGSHTLTFGANYKFPGGTAPTLSTGINAIDILTFVSDGTNMFGVDNLDFQ